MPAALIGTAISVGSSLIHSSAVGPNQDAAAAIFPAAIGGNLAAVQAFRSRANSGSGVVTSVAPWKAGLANIPTSLQNAAEQAVVTGRIPREWWNGVQPAQIPGLVQKYAGVSANPAPAQSAAPGAPAASIEAPALSAAAFSATGFPLWVVLLAAAGAGYLIYKATKAR